jgi:pimeloyl-ACP methyl ester carboxylesterase
MIKGLQVFVGIVILTAIGMGVAYWTTQARLQELTPEIRAGLPGAFVRLSDGFICYQWHGPVDGDIVVLVHGFSTPKFVWDNNINALATAGYRVLRFDHFGRGFSDRPQVVYNTDHYTRELLELLDALSISQPVTLVGYSMGGGNVVGFAAEHPDRVSQLILIAPAGFMPKFSGLASLVLIPGFGDWLMAVAGKGIMLKEIQQAAEAGRGTPNMVARFEEQFQYAGYLPALLSTMRHYPLHDLSAAYRRVGALGIPTYAVWGTDDQTVPYAGAEKVITAIPQTRLYTIEGGGHSITYAEASKVNRLLLDILELE